MFRVYDLGRNFLAALKQGTSTESKVERVYVLWVLNERYIFLL